MKWNVNPLIRAIDRYIQKADEDLEEELKAEGYVATGAAVTAINEIEDKLTDLLNDYTDDLLNRMEKSSDISDFIENVWSDMKMEKDLEEFLIDFLHKKFHSLLNECVKEFLIDADEQLGIDERITKPTQEFIEDWSHELARIMRLNTNKQIEEILIKSQKEAMSIEKVAKAISDSAIRSPGYRARSVALTEVLRIESYSQLEYMRQDPAVEEKEWFHTGSHKNKPRSNHVAINGQKVPKNEPFTLTGADGSVYKPMCPRDTCLPASETVNCHCIMKTIRNEKVMGMTVEERRKLREQYMDEIDTEYVAKYTRDNVDVILNMSDEEQIRYFGGKENDGYAKAALVKSGVIDNDIKLESMWKINSAGKKTIKTLNELADDGIFTVSDKALEHSTIGEYTVGNRLKSGGHGQSCIDKLKKAGKPYVITKTYSNGVRIGYVPDHKNKTKNGNPNKKDSDVGQAWFPESWTDEDIRNAGTYIANIGGNVLNGIKFEIYNGVRIGIFTDSVGNPATIFPDNMKQPKDGDPDTMEGARV